MSGDAFIRQAMIELAAAGSAVVVISQVLEEIFAISNRIAVLSAGRLSEPQLAAQMTAQAVGLLMVSTHLTLLTASGQEGADMIFCNLALLYLFM